MITKTQKIIIAVIVIIILIIIIVMAALVGSGQRNKQNSQDNSDNINVGGQIKEKQSEEASRETQKLIDDIKKISQKVSDLNSEVAAGASVIVNIPGTGNTNASGTDAVAEQGVIVAPGSSILSLTTGDVVTNTGEKASNDVSPGSADAPQQSFSVDPNNLPESTVKLTIFSDSISPETFTVKAGQAVSLAATAGDDRTQIFRFESESLKAIALGLAPGETRSITFNAPTTPGEYIFFSDMSNHRQRGSVGTMIVE